MRVDGMIYMPQLNQQNTTGKELTMKQLTTVLTMILALVAAPSLAAHHEKGHNHSQHQGHEGHGSKAMDASMQMLPAQTVDGVTADVHLKDVRAAMAKMKMPQTHHFMIMFSEAKGDKEVVPTLVALKITDPAGNESAPIELMAMEGHVGGDITLTAPGDYIFKVAAKLADGKRVQYEFTATVK